MKTYKSAIVVAIIFICCIYSSFGQNKTLPSFELPDTKGMKHNLNDFSKDGKIKVISFWATWCVPCKKELNNLADYYEDWKKQYNFELVAIATDDARDAPKVKAYVKGQRWDFTVLLDQNQDLKRALNFQTIPYTIVLDKNGNIVYTHSGYMEGDELQLEEKLKSLASSK